MKRIWMLLLCVAVLCTACGYDPYDPALYGHYKGTTIAAEGYVIDMISVYPGENYIELSENGSGALCLSNHVYDIEWGMKGDEFTLDFSGDESKGTLQNGVIELDYLDMDMVLRFELDADYQPLETMPRQAAVTELQKWWNGDWYGWWMISDGTGEYEAQSGEWWDLCADIYLDEQGRGDMLLWDEDFSRGCPMGLVQLEASGDGTAHAASGHFGADQAVQWYIDTNAYAIDNMIVIEGDYQDSDGSYHYSAYLRPWGQDWQDVENRPYAYEMWYLPLVEQDAPMPDHIGAS